MPASDDRERWDALTDDERVVLGGLCKACGPHWSSWSTPVTSASVAAALWKAGRRMGERRVRQALSGLVVANLAVDHAQRPKRFSPHADGERLRNQFDN